MTSSFRRCVVVLAWLLCAASGSGADAADVPAKPAAMQLDPLTPPALVVATEQGEQALDRHIVMLEDPAGALDLAAVRARPAADWKPAPQLPLSIGYSRSTWWLHFRLRNDGTGPVDRLFEMGSALQDYIDLFVVRGSGQVESFATLGDRVPFSNRPVPSVNPTVPLALAPHEAVDMYLRLSTHDGLYENLPLTLWDARSFARAAQWHWFGTGLFCGLFGLLLLYNAFLYFSTRHADFGLYSGYLAVTLLWRMTFSGDALYLLWPNSPVFNNQVLPLAVGGWLALGLLYGANHLRLPELMPRANTVMLAFAAVSVPVAASALFGVYALPFLLDVPLGLMLPLVFIWSVVLARRGHRRAIWVLVAWTPLLSCGPLYFLQLVGAPGLEWLPYMNVSLQGALALQMLVLAGGLAEDTGRWRRSLLAAERAARVSQENLAIALESEVQQRTRALESANEQLRALTITDALTGVFNRRHFDESLGNELGRLQRHGETPALCLLDVDHFKAYNDRYGHPQGDAALKAVASELKRHLRRVGDGVFRVGGEEFALLLVPGDPELQREYVETLRKAIQALKIPHLDNPPLGVLTASFGLLQIPPTDGPGRSLSAAALYREADRLLYEAKQAGRNCVVISQQPRRDGSASGGFDPNGTQPAGL